MKKQIKQIAKANYSPADYNYHILPVVKNALLLAKKLHANKEIVETAAFLHDIGTGRARKGYKAQNLHHITGAAKTKKILNRLGYDKDFIEAVCHCIISHRGRAGPEPKTLEAKIIACADAMAHFDTFLDLFKFFLEYHDSTEEVLPLIEAKMLRDWNKKLILPAAKRLKKKKFEAIMLLIGSMKEFLPPR